MSSTRITVRNVDSELSRQLRAIGAERGESPTTAVLRLLRDAVGLDDGLPRRPWSATDTF